MRRPALLGQADVVNERAGGGELGAAKTAEPVERAHRVKFLQTTARSLALESWVRQRRQNRLPFGEQLEELGARQHALR